MVEYIEYSTYQFLEESKGGGEGWNPCGTDKSVVLRGFIARDGANWTGRIFFMTKTKKKSYGYPQPKVRESQEISGMGPLKIF